MKQQKMPQKSVKKFSNTLVKNVIFYSFLLIFAILFIKPFLVQDFFMATFFKNGSLITVKDLLEEDSLGAFYFFYKKNIILIYIY